MPISPLDILQIINVNKCISNGKEHTIKLLNNHLNRFGFVKSHVKRKAYKPIIYSTGGINALETQIKRDFVCTKHEKKHRYYMEAGRVEKRNENAKKISITQRRQYPLI